MKNKPKQLSKKELEKEEWEDKLDEKEMIEFLDLIEEEFLKENPNEKED